MTNLFPLNIHIIGQGKLGRSISRILEQKQILHQIHGRNHPTTLDGLIYVCVSEAEIPVVLASLEYKSAIVLHASGSLGLEAFPSHAVDIGCLHPIQSFPGVDIHIPTLIPATLLSHPQISRENKHYIEQFAKEVGFTLHRFQGSRLSYHTAAVLGGNCLTILFSAAKELLTREGYTESEAAELLFALAEQSLHNAKNGTLKDVLTGPIARQQTEVLQRQHHNLAWAPDIQQLFAHFIQVAQNRLPDKN